MGSSSPAPVTPAASPTPTPPPATDPRISRSCARLGPGSLTCECKADTPTYIDEVNAAILKLIAERPELFDEHYKVLSVGAYYVGVIKNLDEHGICAYFDGDELAVKKEDWFSDQYDILTGDGTVRRGASIHAVTCFPSCSTVPTDGQFVAAPAEGCSLPGSKEIACGRDAIHHFQENFEATLDWVIQTYPSIFDLKKTNPGTGDPYIVNGDELVRRVRERMQSLGYCTKWDGEEIGIKKGSNAFSEHYDFTYAAGYLRRGGYTSTCYPSWF